MPKLKIGEILPAAGGLVDTVIGGAFTSMSGRRNRKFAREMYWRQREDALADWNMQNEYNSPAAQMARLKEAGLNPALVYGDGGSVMQSAVMRSSDMTSGNEQPMQGTRLGEGMREMYNVRLANAQLKNQELVAENLRQDIANKKANEFSTLSEAANKVLSSKHLKFDLDRKNELVMQIIENAWAETGLKKAQIDTLVHSNRRAEELHPYNVKMAGKLNTEKDLQNAGHKLDNARKLLENGQFEVMRPIQIAKLRAELQHTLAQVDNTITDTTKTAAEREELDELKTGLTEILSFIIGAGTKMPVSRNPVGFRR